MAFRAIFHHAVRSLLTLLGIVIGIAGIIAIVAIGKGAQKKARDQFLVYGSKSISIYRGNWITPAKSKKQSKPLMLDDMKGICAQCPSVQYISPFAVRGRIEVEYEGNQSSADIVGTNENGINISERTMRSGVYLSQYDVEHKENVVVLCQEIVESLFKSQNPSGKVIRINKHPFTVIGVIAPPKIPGRWDGFRQPNIFIPFSTHQKYFGNYLEQISMSTYTNEQVPEVTRQLEKMFRAAHHLEEGEPNDFMIEDLQTFAAAAEEAAKSVGIFAIIAALIALLVGGIGVMNIMLVAVQERTKEIGIKTALGATMNVIRMQFLLEAIAICMVGGIIGVTFGISASVVLDRIFSIPAIVELTPVLVAFFITVLIGLVFGFYPAERAARLRPVEALTEQ